MQDHTEIHEENQILSTPLDPTDAPRVLPSEVQSAPITDSAGVISRSSKVKKYILYAMIAGLVLSAIISILAVLIGQFTDFIQKSLWTTVSIVIHSLLALMFVSASVKRRSRSDDATLDVLFFITIASFVTSLFSIWHVVSDGIFIGHLYDFYFYAIFATILCRSLLHASRVDRIARLLANVSVGMTIFLLLLLVPAIFFSDVVALPDFYYRSLAATAIVVGTTSVLTAVFHRLYINKQR